MTQSWNAITLWWKREQLLRTVMDGGRQETCDFQKVGHHMLSFGAQVWSLELNKGSSRRFSIAFASTSSTCNWRSVTLTNSKLLCFGVFDRRSRLGVARTRILRRKYKYFGIGIYWSQERFWNFSLNLVVAKCVSRCIDWVSIQEITSVKTQIPAFCALVSFWGEGCSLFASLLLEEQLCATVCHCEQHPIADLHTLYEIHFIVYFMQLSVSTQ